MNFLQKPSFENIVLVRIATTLWNNRDVRALVDEFSFSLSADYFSHTPNGVKEEWKNIEGRVVVNVSQLKIPTHLVEKVLCYIQAVGIQILKWIEYHLKCCNFNVGVPNNFCWSAQGTIDKKKTAEILLKDEAIDITTRFKLACTYCLEDDILKLYENIQRSHYLSFYNEDITEISPNMDLLNFWYEYIREERDDRRENMFYFSGPYLLQQAAEGGNEAAVEYFLQKLTEYFFQKQIEKEELLLKIALDIVQKREYIRGITNLPKQYCTEVLCFLLSQMKDEQQLKVFQKCPIQMLNRLLDWPWQKCFVEIVSKLWNFLPGSLYRSLLRIIIDKMKVGSKDYSYQKLFRYVWQQIPQSYKNDILNDICDSFHLLLQVNDRETINMIFQDISLSEKNKFISSDGWRCLCAEDLTDIDEYNLLKFILPLCLLSKDEMIKFKQEFQKYVQTSSKRRNRNDLYEFFQTIDDHTHAYDKRKSSDDGESNPAKRHFNNEFKE